MGKNINEKEILKIFSQRLSEVINENENSNAGFAKKIGVSSSIVSLYLAGKRNPKGTMLYNIAKTCHVSADWLLGLSDNKKIGTLKESTMPLSLEFAIRFSRLLTERNMTKFEFTKQYEIMSNQKNAKELALTCARGKSGLSLRTLLITSQIFNVSIDYLLGIKEEKN
jgi:transcriptional regulator with XRE-family HTH domain